MKIKTQFTVFLVVINLIPLIIFGSIFLADYYRSSEKNFVPSYDELDTDMVEIHSQDWKRVKRFISRLPVEVEVAVLDANGFVVYSVIKEITEQNFFSEDNLIDLLKNDAGKYIYQIDRHFNSKSNSPITIITRLLKQIRYEPNKRVDFLNLVTMVLVLLLVICIVVVSSIVWSVSKSVSLLEKETRRIAEGSLEDEIKVKGTNEITSLTKSLNNMRKSLLDSQKRRSKFIMGISHDLRTPIALIKGYAEAITDGLVDSPELHEKSLKIIATKIDQLEDMVDDLINFVRLDGGDWKATLKKISIQPLLSSYASQLQGDGSMLKRIVVCDVDIPKATQVQLDEHLFLRMLENICGNALRYTQDGGTVTLSAYFVHSSKNSTESSDLIKITVKDDGCGISEQDLPYIFDMFYRGSNSRREDGKGLGLAVVKTIVDSFGWKISVESEKNKGSIFTVLIPVA